MLAPDACAGYDRLYEAGRRPGPIVEVGCWAHARRKFFDMAQLDEAPIAIETVARIDALFAIERDISGLSPEERRKVCRIYTQIETARLNEVDPQACPTDVLARLPDHPAKRLAELLPWNRRLQLHRAAARVPRSVPASTINHLDHGLHRAGTLKGRERLL
jgi:hypothetical protein